VRFTTLLSGSQLYCAITSRCSLESSLLHRNRFREVPGLIHVAAAQDRDVVRQ
jgi:hypothetical protein